VTLGSLASKPVQTPLNPFVKLHQDTSKPFKDILSYKIWV